ncbi:galactosylxylosylprotein 3-beta- galactosyltransferase Pvg1 [Schizosaccharomyces cryophilus OY26]|uniref:Hexosyltransferase n=1 Tax=Schizosaccharomyces cryophilus (strain OY26 / ATCC MYA-4695 / CBS 11777 / NBRC 106824 / NRRL Y48691) TaxID=653667 RepID=S9W2T2_SCHCR|nr:galactosylxylosylprotein 3-beta- galactosyltransferase Pvg1 [Schizosaccharomyces cryophilus OY26]EPY52849.1 galactosylxylosylprotein 3-beta- galactosyltransferase Pvg1 [Schizosaccharomyces cryophilus OY26]
MVANKNLFFSYLVLSAFGTVFFFLIMYRSWCTETKTALLLEEMFLSPLYTNQSTAPRPLRMCLGVFSHANNVERRRLLREDYHHYIREFASKDKIDVKFVLGVPDTNEGLAAIREEQRKYGDLEVLPIGENVDRGKSIVYFQTFLKGYRSYPLLSDVADGHLLKNIQYQGGTFVYNETIETHELPGMKEFQDLGAPRDEYDFIAKVDDDAYVNLPLLFSELRPHIGEDEFYFGRDCTRKELPTSVREFPYMCGFAYVVSPDIAHHIASGREIVYPWEDVQTGYNIYKSGDVQNIKFTRYNLYDLVLHSEGYNPRQAFLRFDALVVHKLKTNQLSASVIEWYRKMYEHRAYCQTLSGNEKRFCMKASYPLVATEGNT